MNFCTKKAGFERGLPANTLRHKSLILDSLMDIDKLIPALQRAE